MWSFSWTRCFANGRDPSTVRRRLEKAPSPDTLPKGVCVITPVCVSFRGAAGDEESRIALKILRARFLAEFILSGQSEILRFAQNDSEGLGMTA